ncbi:MAG: hypothetical protein ACOVQA_01275 [Thermoflexibacteraceae bacterium]
MPKASFSQSKISDYQQIDKNIYLLWFDAYNNKSIVGEFGNYLVLIEFPQNDTLSYQIIDFLKAKFPKKEIKYVTHSHHHNHSISSFNPFLEKTNAKLITTQFNFGELKKLTKDTLSLAKRSIIFDSMYHLKDKLNALTIYKVAQSAQYKVPTKEYLLAYFPHQALLVSGCLLNKPKTYYEVVNQRKVVLKKFLTATALQPKNFVPTNSSRANGFEDICTAEILDSALVKGIIPDELCDKLQSQKVEYLFAKTDSLAAEFKKRPISFDYLVCGNTFRQLRKDYFRALAIFKALTIVYPKEVESYYYAAECYEALGFRHEAQAYFELCLPLVKTEADINDVKERIKKLSKQ